ncbi:MAG: MmcQ/YjbR family DNA-binding protein [Anaerolineaceae bacterium]|nr:MmcQ/YjbR family DNA-binding protein [Anaerolineaceae bacterium]
MKDRSAFGLDGNGTAEILCFKQKDHVYADILMEQPGYLRGYPSPKWNWVSVLLDGSIPLEDICHCLDESYEATKGKGNNLKTLLIKRVV